MMGEIEWQFEGRRKPETFSLYKPDEENNVVIQSDKTIAQINLNTGKGLLNAKGSGGKYFHHLTFAEEHQFPKKLVDLIKANIPKSGDVIGGGIVWG
jgi:hypothetical protein